MRYASIKLHDVINGPGVRVSIFVTGCNHNCKGCFNKVAQDPNYGKEWTEEVEQEILDYIHKYQSFIRGISLLGGEPTYETNADILALFCKKFKKEFPDKDIWVWSGNTFEEIKANPQKYNLIKECDTLIDGRFVEELKDVTLQWRGSSNQRVIDIKKELN